MFNNNKILLVAPSNSSFIKSDLEILNSSFPTTFALTWGTKTIIKTTHKVFEHDICIFWFASIRFIPIFLVAKALRKTTFVVAGGYDVSTLHEANYFDNPIISFCRKLFLNQCDKVITVSKSNTVEAITNARIPKSKIEHIYLGFKKPEVELKSWKNRKNQIVFIASYDRVSAKVKGFEIFFGLAQAMPDITFIHIGYTDNKLLEACKDLKNIFFKGFIENYNDNFSQILNESKGILLPSKIESFGASIVEGALHGCIPITSDRFALPEIVGTHGYICKLNDREDFINAIKKVISDEVDPTKIQSYYYNRFNYENRRNKLKILLNLNPG